MLIRLQDGSTAKLGENAPEDGRAILVLGVRGFTSRGEGRAFRTLIKGRFDTDRARLPRR